MDTEALEALREVVDAGSVTAAAQRLRRSQPGVSRMVQRLESELGVRLIDRGPHGARATPAGERVARFAADVLQRLETLRAELHDGASELHGTVRVVASTTPGEYLVPDIVSRFCNHHPAVRVEVAVTDSAAVPPTLLDHAADVGITGRKNPDRRLTHTAIARDEIVLAVPAAHPFAAERTVPLAALEGERLIWREDGSGTQRVFMETLAHAGAELPDGSSAVSLGSTQAVVAAVAAGLGIGVVSLRAVADSDRAVPVRLEKLPVVRSLWLVYETNRPRAPHVAAFIALAAAADDHGEGHRGPAPSAVTRATMPHTAQAQDAARR